MSTSQIPTTMKAVRLVEYNKPYQIQEIPVPSAKDLHPQDLLVKVGAASLCHTDSMAATGMMGSPLPMTACHEGAGTVVAVGSEVRDWSIGDLCLVPLSNHLCGECSNCKGPEVFHQYCWQGGAAPGLTGDGAFAEYMVADSLQASKIPESIPFSTAAPLACAGRTVFRGLELAQLQSGQWLGIVGSGGGLGHLAIAFAKARGLRVVGVDARDFGLELTRECGADMVLDARHDKEEVVRKAMAATGAGCDATLNVSDADSSAALAASITRQHCSVIQIAQPLEIKIPFQEMVFRDIRFQGSLVASKSTTDKMLKVTEEHGIRVKSHMLRGIEKVPELVELAHTGTLKGRGVILIDGEAN